MIENFVANFASLLPFNLAFSAGMVTTVSPCGIAMLPAYVSLYLGSQEEGFWAQSSFRRVARALTISAAVTLSFVAFFGVMGAILSRGGEFLTTYIPWVAVIIGIALILLGVYLLTGGHLYTNLPARLAARLGNPKSSSIKSFLVFGIAYGVAVLSCALPVFLVVVVGSLNAEGFASGLLQFVSFALGMGFIILLVTIGSALFKETVNRWLHRLVPVVNRFSGLLLIFAGGYIIYYWFTEGDILS
jgi:cytochrome c biogenesis protein CcdA